MIKLGSWDIPTKWGRTVSIRYGISECGPDPLPTTTETSGVSAADDASLLPGFSRGWGPDFDIEAHCDGDGGDEEGWFIDGIAALRQQSRPLPAP